ncbi:MAG: hypothetical protein ACFB2Z_11670 [Maricaulaceae bacterium]
MRGAIIVFGAALVALSACSDAPAPFDPEAYADTCALAENGLSVQAGSERVFCSFEDEVITVAFDGLGRADLMSGEAGASIITDETAGRSVCRMDRWGRGGCAACPAPGLIESDFAQAIVAARLAPGENLAGVTDAPPPARDPEAELATLKRACETELVELIVAGLFPKPDRRPRAQRIPVIEPGVPGATIRDDFPSGDARRVFFTGASEMEAGCGLEQQQRLTWGTGVTGTGQRPLDTRAALPNHPEDGKIMNLRVWSETGRSNVIDDGVLTASAQAPAWFAVQHASVIRFLHLPEGEVTLRLSEDRYTCEPGFLPSADTRAGDAPTLLQTD